MALRTMLVEHALDVDGRTNEQERKAESTDGSAAKTPAADAEDDRTDNRRELGQTQAFKLDDGHPCFP